MEKQKADSELARRNTLRMILGNYLKKSTVNLKSQPNRPAVNYVNFGISVNGYKKWTRGIEISQ